MRKLKKIAKIIMKTVIYIAVLYVSYCIFVIVAVGFLM